MIADLKTYDAIVCGLHCYINPESAVFLRTHGWSGAWSESYDTDQQVWLQMATELSKNQHQMSAAEQGADAEALQRALHQLRTAEQHITRLAAQVDTAESALRNACIKHAEQFASVQDECASDWLFCNPSGWSVPA